MNNLELERERSELVTALTALNAELGQFEVWSVTMSAPVAEKRRADLIAKKSDVERRIGVVRLAIKERNVARAQQAKVDADARRAAKQAKHAKDNAPRPRTLNEAERGPHNKRDSPLGEQIQGIARLLRRKIREVPAPKAFTTEFLARLDDFIVDQRRHLASEDIGTVRGHHFKPDLACPECGTDAATGCIARSTY